MPEHQTSKFYYKSKAGHEHRKFPNTKTYDNGVIESDVELHSPYLEQVEVKKESAEVNKEQSTNEEQA